MSGKDHVAIARLALQALIYLRVWAISHAYRQTFTGKDLKSPPETPNFSLLNIQILWASDFKISSKFPTFLSGTGDLIGRLANFGRPVKGLARKNLPTCMNHDPYSYDSSFLSHSSSSRPKSPRRDVQYRLSILDSLLANLLQESSLQGLSSSNRV